MDSNHKCFGACICFLIFILVPSIVCIVFSFQTLEQIHIAVDYNAIACTVDGVKTKAGLYFLGLGHSLIRYPRTIQTMEFLPGRDGLMARVRTQDGLQVSLTTSFQYKFNEESLVDLFLTYDEKHLPVYEAVAEATIAYVAANFTAYEFFNDKARIASVILLELQRVFLKLFASVSSMQLATVELPALFQEAVLESIGTKQNITTSQRYKDNMVVTYASQELVASRDKNQTVIMAAGLANRRMQEAEAAVSITRQTVLAEIDSYAQFSEVVGLQGMHSLSYIWWDTNMIESTGGATVAKKFVAGVNPETYVAKGF